MTATRGRDRRPYLIFGAVSLALLVLPVLDLIQASSTGTLREYLAVDYDLYMEATRRWLAGGPFYEPYQLAGPYPITPGDILYPPFALVLLVPFTVLPAILWWAIPLAIVVVALVRIRPDPRLWPFLALCIVWPPTIVKLVTGNPVIWVVAAAAGGVLFAWPYVFVLLKPSLFPVALLGARHRSWWIALGGLGLVALPFGSMWVDWVTTLVNSEGGGLLYSIQELPMVLLPVIAAIPIARWFEGRRRDRVAAAAA